jgi:quinol-cytochrome oxidoreductase complex cytochrome b subunit/cytochrome c551/c552
MRAKRERPGLSATFIVCPWALLTLNLLVGLLLHLRYEPSLSRAYASTATLHSEPLWRFLAGFHYWASGVALLLCFVAVSMLAWNGEHRWETRWTWWPVLGMTLLALALQITGNILPLSAHDARTANVEAGVIAAVPWVGPVLKEQLLGGETFGQHGLSRLYVAHAWIAPALVALVILFIGYRLFRTGWRPHWPLVIAIVGLTAFLGLTPGAPLGRGASEADLASTGALPMWYVVPLHALRIWFGRSGCEWVGTALIPLVAVSLLFALPFLFRKSAGPSVMVRLGLLATAVVLVLLCAVAGEGVQSPLSDNPIESGRSNGGNLPIDRSMSARGAAVFREQGCGGCHKVGVVGHGAVGPNLAGVGSRHSEVQWLMEMVRNPASKGRAGMPPFKEIPLAELRSLAEYLRSLK